MILSSKMTYFDLYIGRRNNLITAPHGSRLLPDKTKAPEPGDRGTDYLALLLAQKSGGSAVIAHYSRMFMDFNAPGENCVKAGFHAYKTHEISAEELKQRQKIYDKYYDTLNSLIKKDTFHLALHAMYYKGPKGSMEEGLLRPDFRIGTREYSTIGEEKTNNIKHLLEGQGFSVEVDNVFKGGEEIKRTSEFGAQAIQLEINSNLLLSDNNLPYEDKTFNKKKVEKLAEILNSEIIFKSDLK